jgi:hypothetical protein
MSDNTSISVTYNRFYVITYYENNHELQSGDNDQVCIKTDFNGIAFDIPVEGNRIPGIIYIIALDNEKYISVSNYVLDIEENEVCSTLLTSFVIPIMLNEAVIGLFNARMFEIINVEHNYQHIENLYDQENEYFEWEEHTDNIVVPHLGFAYAGLVYDFRDSVHTFAFDEWTHRLINMDPTEVVDCVSIAFAKMIASDSVSNFVYSDGELKIKTFLFPVEQDIRLQIDSIKRNVGWDHIDVFKLEKFTHFKTHVNLNIDSSLNSMIGNIYDTNVKKQIGFVFGTGDIIETHEHEKVNKLGEFESSVLVEHNPKLPAKGVNDNPEATLCITARSFVAIATLRTVLAYHAIQKQKIVDKEKSIVMKLVNKKKDAKKKVKVPGRNRLLKWGQTLD